MYSKSAIFAATAMASLAPTVYAENSGTGNAIINNKCSHDIYLWSIGSSADAEQHTIASGETFSENYRTTSNGGGVSLKMSLTESQDEVSQFEYTIVEPQVFYDLSNINGYPFAEGGITIEPSDSSCPSISCEAGEPNCKEAYNQPYDDWATKGCDCSSDLVLNLCASGSSSGPSSSSGSSSTLETSASTATASPVVRKRDTDFKPYGTGNSTQAYPTGGPTASPGQNQTAEYKPRHPHYRYA
ncbi:hypothetical protein FQN54_009380 [Arachnomyces sp. PD_36]|nr:hypothetical protein FQN54_009380 [Arachnomyces sp. PD_36]